MIPSSELIINERGAIYHINMKPGELADTVITVGDPARVDMVCEHFDTIEHEASHREFNWKTGLYQGTQITVISTGIGPDNIDIVINELDAVANIDFQSREILPIHRALNIIRLGTTGGLNSDVKLDDLVVSAMAIGLDNLMHYYQYKPTLKEIEMDVRLQELNIFKDTAIKPYTISASSQLLSHFDDQWLKGITLTAPGFYGPQGRTLRAKPFNATMIDTLAELETGLEYKFCNFEMETSAILGLSKILGHHATAVSTIIAHRSEDTFSKDTHASVQNMIAKTLPIIKKF